VQQLALKVRVIDDVKVHDPECPDSGRGKVQPERRAEAAGADQQDARILEPLLPRDADLGQKQVTAVSLDLLSRELDRVGDGRTSCDRRDDVNFVACTDNGGKSVEMPDVLVIDVDVHKAAQHAVVGVEVALEHRKAGDDRIEGLAGGSCGNGHASLVVREASERGWDVHD